MIKEVVLKQMRKPYYRYTQPKYIQEPNDIDMDEPEKPAPAPPPQTIHRRRKKLKNFIIQYYIITNFLYLILRAA